MLLLLSLFVQELLLTAQALHAKMLDLLYHEDDC
jgi:hypothetical protein